MAVSLTEARTELVQRRILEGVAVVLGRGEPWTFANVAKAAGVPERTLYRYFPTREALLDGIFGWANERLGFHGDFAKDQAGLQALVRRCFPGFDELAPVVRELLLVPEGRLARLRHKARRQRASLQLVQHEAGGLRAKEARHVAAVLQLLSQAGTWHALREYWDMNGAEAAEASALAIELLLDGARARQERAKRKDHGKRKPRAEVTT